MRMRNIGERTDMSIYLVKEEDTIDKIDIKTLEAIGFTIEYILKNADKIF